MSRLKLAVICTAAVLLGGCVPYYAGYEHNLYAPGGTLADKSEGSHVLAGATEASLNAMLPAGTSKSVVMQVLGNPFSSTSSSDGSSAQTFSHTFTSYSRKMVQMKMAIVEYDAGGLLKKLSFTDTTSTW